jgi:hypothetical protein
MIKLLILLLLTISVLTLRTSTQQHLTENHNLNIAECAALGGFVCGKISK